MKNKLSRKQIIEGLTSIKDDGFRLSKNQTKSINAAIEYIENSFPRPVPLYTTEKKYCKDIDTKAIAATLGFKDLEIEYQRSIISSPSLTRVINETLIKEIIPLLKDRTKYYHHNTIPQVDDVPLRIKIERKVTCGISKDKTFQINYNVGNLFVNRRLNSKNIYSNQISIYTVTIGYKKCGRYNSFFLDHVNNIYGQMGG